MEVLVLETELVVADADVVEELDMVVAGLETAAETSELEMLGDVLGLVEGVEPFEPTDVLEEAPFEVADAISDVVVALELASSVESSSYPHSSQSLLSSTLARNSDGFCCQLCTSYTPAYLLVLPLPEHEGFGPLKVVQGETLAEVVRRHEPGASAVGNTQAAV